MVTLSPITHAQQYASKIPLQITLYCAKQLYSRFGLLPLPLSFALYPAAPRYTLNNNF
tara:strand:+ start:196 stop:369 length:174 start_codon:yes stop_codon:yes gene_type:complete